MKAILISTLFLCFTCALKAQSNFSITQDGKHIVYYDNGNVKSQGNYLNNRREGEWLFFYDNGKIALKKNFSKGIQVGEWAYYNQDGGLLLKVDDISKINDNAEMALYENNKVKSKSVNGKKETDFISNKPIELNKKF